MRFLLVDSILALTPGVSIVAQRRVPDNEELFQDHFPGFPVMPGVLLTEMMAQAAGKCLAAQRLPRGVPMLAKILSASFRAWVRPGDAAVLHATIEANEERYATAECRLEVEGRVAAQARLMFSFVPASQFAPGLRDEVLDRFMAEHAS